MTTPATFRPSPGCRTAATRRCDSVSDFRGSTPRPTGRWPGAWDEEGRVEPRSLPAAIEHAHRRLAQSPCLLVTATLDDIAAVRERPNQPGVIGPPSWSLALPQSLEELENLALAKTVAGVLSRAS